MAVELLALPAMAYAAVSDIRSRTIPDSTVCCVAALGAADAALCRLPWPDLLIRLTPALLLLLLAVCRGGLGGGDVKLFAALCLFCEPGASTLALLLAMAVTFAAGKITKRGSLPFAPFLCGGFLLVFILKIWGGNIIESV